MVAVRQYLWNHCDSFHTCLSDSWAGKTQTARGQKRWDSLSLYLYVAFSSGLSHMATQDNWSSYIGVKVTGQTPREQARQNLLSSFMT